MPVAGGTPKIDGGPLAPSCDSFLGVWHVVALLREFNKRTFHLRA